MKGAAGTSRSRCSTWVYLVRHGEVERAAEGRFFGHTDVALSATGRRQVAALGDRLGGEAIAAVYASDLRRARESAAPLAATRGVAAMAVPELREMAMGRWEGLTFAEMRAREPDTVTRWLADPVTFAFPEGESLEDLRVRIIPALEVILARHPGQRIAIFAHGGSNRIILAEALGLPLGNVLRLAQDYAGWNLIEYGERGAVVHVVNQCLEGPLAAPPAETTTDG